MKKMIWAFVPVLILGAASPSVAAKPKSKTKTVESAAATVETASATVETVVAEAPAASCIAKKKEKKKSGLGGLLRAARNSGLLNVVAGHTGTGAVVSSVANTAIDVAAADTSESSTVHEFEKPKC